MDRGYTRRRGKKSGSKRRLWLLVLALVISLGGLAYSQFSDTRLPEVKVAQNSASASDAPAKTPEKPAYTPIDLQPAVDAWASKQRADFHIVVYDLQAKKNIAAHDPDTVIFAASLYKEYVAYLALLDIQNGAMDPNEVLLGDQTIKTCLDKMIRSSDSPCGEAMMARMGRDSLNHRVKDLGMTGTSFSNITTTAADTARILEYVAAKRDLNDENTAFLLDAMSKQDERFRHGLAAGAPQATWATKVGWNEDINYHDIGIMTMPDGRKFVVAILGQGSGASAPIADFARTIYAGLTL